MINVTDEPLQISPKSQQHAENDPQVRDSPDHIHGNNFAPWYQPPQVPQQNLLPQTAPHLHIPQNPHIYTGYPAAYHPQPPAMTTYHHSNAFDVNNLLQSPHNPHHYPVAGGHYSTAPHVELPSNAFSPLMISIDPKIEGLLVFNFFILTILFNESLCYTMVS